MHFYDRIQRWGQAPALLSEQGDIVTYAALAEAADQLAVHLGGPGLAFLLAENSHESVTGYLACLRSRTPVAMQPAGLHAELLTKLLGTYKPRYVWLPRTRAGEVPGGKEHFAQGNYVLMTTGAEPLSPHPDLALLLSTSGSTGSPKLVRQSYRNIAANAASIANYLKLGDLDRPITTLPMSYVYGLSVINSHLLCGAAIVLTDKSLTEKGFWDALRSRQATSLAGVPYTFEMLKRLRFERMDLPHLKVITQAGGKLNASLVHEFASSCRDKGIRFYVMYGAAEATARMAYLPPEYSLEKPASIGIAIPGGAFTLEDENGAVIERPAVVGELVYRGDNVTLGYASRREDLALGDERGGVLRTGDLARFDEDRFYYIVGRKSRFIKVFGNRVNLEELEQHIGTKVIDCACAGEDDRLRIYITNGSRKEAVVAFVEELTGLHHSAYSVIVIDRVPRNEAGKITYAALP